jgi:FtsH-binding integral membrane protein
MAESAEYTTGHRVLGSVETIGTTGVFGQVMGLVGVTVAFTALGAYLGRNLTGGWAIACFIGGFIAIFMTSAASRRSESLAITALFAAGLLLGLGLGPGIAVYASTEPNVVWQAAGATALFIGGLGAVGYAIRSDLSFLYRFLFFALLALIVFGLVAIFVSIPASNTIYCVLGLVIFGGYTIVDFNRMRRAGMQDSVPLAAGIFLDVLNVFLFFLSLFSRD